MSFAPFAPERRRSIVNSACGQRGVNHGDEGRSEPLPRAAAAPATAAPSLEPPCPHRWLHEFGVVHVCDQLLPYAADWTLPGGETDLSPPGGSLTSILFPLTETLPPIDVCPAVFDERSHVGREPCHLVFGESL